MADILSKEEQKEYAEEIEYNQADESRRKELLKEQQDKYERENTRRKYQEDVEYEEEKRKTITLPTPKSTQQRETLPEESRPSSEDLEYEYASTERKREILSQEQAPAPKKPNKSEKFEKDQDNWNQQQKAKYQREEIEEKGKEYEKEQAELFEKNKKKGAFGAFNDKIKKIDAENVEASKKRKEARDAANAGKPTWKEIAFKTADSLGKNAGALGKRSTSPKGKQTKGQFHAPGGKGQFRDPFAAMDPFGGFGGGKMRNMMNVPSPGGFGLGGQPAQPQAKMTAKQEKMAKVRAAKAAPAAPPRKFADPFAGLRIIPARSPTMPARRAKQKRPGDISTALAKEFGLGSGKKQSKKPKKIDWMNF